MNKLHRKGLFDFADEELWVVTKEKNTEKEQIVGKCILVHLPEKEVNVMLVPLKESLDLQSKITEIQQFYTKVGVNLAISVDTAFPIMENISTENQFGDLSTYSPDQQHIISAYTAERSPKSDVYYIFVGEQTSSQQGYMRLGGQFGFAMDNNARTIAHELGHGIFKLEHPFKDKSQAGKTASIMDYGSGTDFLFPEWKQIGDPAFKIGIFQGQEEGEFFKNHLNVPENLRLLRLCKKYDVHISVQEGSGGEIKKGFIFFEYKTEDKITIFYEKEAILKISSLKKSEKYSNFYNKQMYQIRIENVGFINCLSEKDRDVLYNFLTQEKFEYMLQNTITIKNKKIYSYNLIYNDLEKIKADLIKNKTYKNLFENEKLLLDLPLIMWSKKWEYGSIFMYNWFMQEGDIEMDDDLYAFLDKWGKFKSIEKDFLSFVSKHKNKKINQEIKEDTFRLYALNDLKKHISNKQDEEIYFDANFETKYTNFSRFSVEVSFSDINNPYVASFGTFGVGFLLEGDYNKEKEEITIINIWEEINDRFDFKDEGFNEYYSQRLGSWKDNDIFDYQKDIEINYIGGVSNKVFINFKKNTGIGKDYKIRGKRIYKNKFIEKIKINKNEIQYE